MSVVNKHKLRIRFTTYDHIGGKVLIYKLHENMKQLNFKTCRRKLSKFKMRRRNASSTNLRSFDLDSTSTVIKLRSRQVTVRLFSGFCRTSRQRVYFRLFLCEEWSQLLVAVRSSHRLSSVDDDLHSSSQSVSLKPH